MCVCVCIYIYIFFLILLVNCASSPYGTKVHGLYSADRASLYNLVNETNLAHDSFLVYLFNFIYNLHMFRTSPGPSSGGKTVFMWCLVLIILYSWLTGIQDWMKLHTRQSAVQNNKYQVSHKYICSSSWWTWRGPKYVEVINKFNICGSEHHAL